jgi:tetratricopeptide (TPR) repeat protein
VPAAPAVEVDPGFLRRPPFKDDSKNVAAFSVALTLLPLYPDAYYWRSTTYFLQPAPDRALADFERFLALVPKSDPRRPEVQLRVASIYNARRDVPNTIAALVETLDAPPDRVPFPDVHANLCNNVAWSLASPRNARPPETVIRLAEKAVELEPFNFSFQNTFGVVLYRLGRHADAVQCLNRNLEPSGTFVPFDLYFLAMSYAKLGQADKARECFDRADAAVTPKAEFSASERAELADFRAEAADVLGVAKSK